MQRLSSDIVALLQCPVSGSDLELVGSALIAAAAGRRYGVSPAGIPLLADGVLSRDGETQRHHYDRVADGYLANLTYPHTREYSAYLDRALFAVVGDESLGTVAEICCGAGEGLQLLGRRVARGIGIDVSTRMLEAAVESFAGDPTRVFVQGDATRLPLKSAAFDTVAILGGIHHVNDRDALFGEVARILKPGGRLLFREPVDDFVLWRLIRAVVYRMASSLEADTEHPIRHRHTADALARAGLRLTTWQTHGFLSYCFLMNADVLPINRVWQYVPGVRGLTRAAARFDDLLLHAPGLSGAGLIAIGAATRPA
jgi:SAM-dependent methyltransferase